MLHVVYSIAAQLLQGPPHRAHAMGELHDCVRDWTRIGYSIVGETGWPTRLGETSCFPALVCIQQFQGILYQSLQKKNSSTGE